MTPKMPPDNRQGPKVEMTMRELVYSTALVMAIALIGGCITELMG